MISTKSLWSDRQNLNCKGPARWMVPYKNPFLGRKRVSDQRGNRGNCISLQLSSGLKCFFMKFCGQKDRHPVWSYFFSIQALYSHTTDNLKLKILVTRGLFFHHQFSKLSVKHLLGIPMGSISAWLRLDFSAKLPPKKAKYISTQRRQKVQWSPPHVWMKCKGTLHG